MGGFMKYEMCCGTRMLCPCQGVVVLVEMTHYGFPLSTNAFKLFPLTRELISDVFSLENVLENVNVKFIYVK